MAKVFFNKRGISSENLTHMSLNDEQYQETKPLAYQTHFLVKECSDEDYNNFYRGRKNIVINEDESISSVDIPTEDINQTEIQFTKSKDDFYQKLIDFKEKFPNHSKISEIDSIINFVANIDISSLTFPHVHFNRYLINNDKFIILNFI